MSPRSNPANQKPLSASAAKLRLLKRLRCTLTYEKKAWQCGARLIAGVDEVGRGSLFGPVVAAAVILDPQYRIRGLRDSKLLPAERREVLAARIRDHAVAWAIAAVDAVAQYVLGGAIGYYHHTMDAELRDEERDFDELPAEEFPNMTRVLAEAHYAGFDEEFEFGLDAIVRGLLSGPRYEMRG